MSIVSGFFNQNIDTVFSITRDGYGDTTQSIVYTDVPCRWSESIGEVISEEGQVIGYKAQVWLDPKYDLIDESYEVSYNSINYKVISYEKRRGLEGKIDHIKLYLV